MNEQPPKDPYPVKEVGEVIDRFLAEGRRSKRPKKPPTAYELAGMLGSALERWPDDFDGADRDRVSQIIYVLDQITEREEQNRG